MEKKGGFIIIIVVAIIAIIIISLGVWQAIKIIKNNNETNNISELGNLSKPANETTNLAGETGTNEIGTNETSANETEEINAKNIPNPTGSIISISRKDSAGEYFCNNTENPTHAIRVYTYKIINGTKNLSENYIESKKINVCDDYNNETVMAGVIYAIDWEWDAVDRIDGYKIYQYFYLNKNVSREYDHYIDIKTNHLLDTGRDLWR